LNPLSIGDSVRFRQGDLWSRQGKVVNIRPEQRSYDIKTDKDTMLRRNRRHLLKTNEDFSPKCVEEYYEQHPVIEHENESLNEPSSSIPNEVDINDSTSIKRSRYGREIKTPKRFSE